MHKPSQELTSEIMLEFERRKDRFNQTEKEMSDDEFEQEMRRRGYKVKRKKSYR